MYILTDCDEYQFRVQHVDNLLFLHLSVYEWKPSVFKKLLLDLESLKAECRGRGVESLWVCIPDNDEKLLKFQKMFGFEPLLKNENKLYLVQDC